MEGIAYFIGKKSQHMCACGLMHTVATICFYLARAIFNYEVRTITCFQNLTRPTMKNTFLVPDADKYMSEKSKAISYSDIIYTLMISMKSKKKLISQLEENAMKQL